MTLETEHVACDCFPMRFSRDGRLRLPATWRDLFITSAEPVLWLLPFGGRLLFMIPEDRMEAERGAITALEQRPRNSDDPQGHWEAIIAALRSAREVRIGSEGRFRVPRELREMVGLGEDVVLVGCFDRAEIWSPARWAQETQSFFLPA